MILHKNNNTSEDASPTKQTIVIVDSGLGGISVQAKLDKKIRNSSPHLPIELLYFNVRPSCGTEYVNMQLEDSVRTLEREMRRIIYYQPDIILFACNTLSVIYPKIAFSSFSKIPVIDNIIDFGVRMILNHLRKRPDGNVIILATDLTINSEMHKNKLLAGDVPEDQIITQACKDLDVEIQYGNITVVKRLIRQYLQEAKDKMIKPSQDIVLALCCTHYQFGAKQIEEIAGDIFDSNLTLLNPNESMPEVIQWDAAIGKNKYLEINNKVYSSIPLCESEIQSIGLAIQEEAPAVYLALKNYCHIPDTRSLSKLKNFKAPQKNGLQIEI